MLRFFSILFLLLGIAADSAQAAPRRVALVIGQSYEQGKLDPLPNPANDASRMIGLLTKHGFDVISCDGTRPGCFDLSRTGLLRALVSLELAAENADVAFVFYAGHGMEGEMGNIVVPTDAEIDCETWQVKNGVLVDQLVLAVKGARQKIIVLDACRDNPIKACPPIAKYPNFSFKDIKVPDADEFLLVTSTKPGQVALDGPEGGHSPFAKALFDTLDNHPHIFFDQVFNRVAKSVYDATKADQQSQIPETLVRGGAPETCLAGRDCATDPSGAVFIRELSALRTSLAGELAALRKEDHFAAIDRAKRDMPQGNQGQVSALEHLVKAGFGFKGADLSGIFFGGAKLDGAGLSGALLEGADFSDTEFRRSDLTDAGMEFTRLRKAHFIDTKLDNAFLAFADAEGLRLSGEQTKSSKRANWHGANLRGANLSGADLSGASFALADLRGADLRGAVLRNTLFIGTQFDSSTQFDGATFDNTDISSAVGMKDLLSADQTRGVCARPAYRGNVLGFEYRIIEPVPSGRFSEGYEYRDILQYHDKPYIAATSHLTNPRCRSVDENELPGSIPPIYNNLLYGEIGFRLSHKLLENGGRRREVLKTVASVKERVGSLVKEADFLRSDTTEIDRHLDFMRAATKNLKKPAFVCLSSDLFKLATSGYVQMEDSHMRVWAIQRAHDEKNSREEHAFMIEGLGGAGNLRLFKQAKDPWGEFYPTNFNADMITLDVIKAFRDWNTERLKLLDGKVSLCMFPHMGDKGNSQAPQYDMMSLRYWSSRLQSHATADQSQWKFLQPADGNALVFGIEPAGMYVPPMRNSGYRVRGDYSGEIAHLLSKEAQDQKSHWQRWEMRIEGAEVLPKNETVVLDLSKDTIHGKLELAAPPQ